MADIYTRWEGGYSTVFFTMSDLKRREEEIYYFFTSVAKGFLRAQLQQKMLHLYHESIDHWVCEARRPIQSQLCWFSTKEFSGTMMSAPMDPDAVRLPNWFVPSDRDVICGWYVPTKQDEMLETAWACSRSICSPPGPQGWSCNFVPSTSPSRVWDLLMPCHSRFGTRTHPLDLLLVPGRGRITSTRGISVSGS